ncbi:MAG TPA: glycosyltransferase [Coriobacteriia bacterium]|nr:glycosyltransferase [Coriobacteriia bacterium]
MRVAMVTPMTPESAIADVMCQAVPALCEEWDLDVWCPAEPRYRSSAFPTIPYAAADRETVDALATYDLVVYVLGDSPLHARILPLARTLPGLVVLHDASMTNLVRHTAVETGTLPELVAHVRSTCGPELADLVERPESGTPTRWLEVCAEVPLDTYATENALGAVVHSRWHADRIDGRLLGDVTVAPLPVPSSRLGMDTDEGSDPGGLLADLPDDAVLLVTVGNLNANRHVDVLLRAIATGPGLARVHLWAVGASRPDDAATVNDLAQSLGVERRFVVTGRVSDASLEQILRRADIGAALRHPVLEGQSASALTTLLAGVPVVVYDEAHYAELPDDVAVKVAPAAGPDGVAAGLVRLVADPAGRRAMGERARDHVLLSRSGSAYAAALVDAAQLALARRVHAHLAADLTARLRRLGLHEKPVIVERVARHAFDLYDLA